MSKRAISVVIVTILALPLLASALTLDEIKVQLLGILEKVTALQSTIEISASTASDNQPILPCLSLGRTLRAGMSGEDVQKLQEFLIRSRVLAEGKATGYFGPLTEAAVKKWQASQGVVSSGSAESTGYGVVGPKTRAVILSTCKEQVAKSRGSQARSCPHEPAFPNQSGCAGSWQKGYDTAGCITGYQCIATTSPVVASSAIATPSLTILSPASGTIATGGNTLRISWQGINLPSDGGVDLFLLDASELLVGEIARNLASSGIYLWRVPQGDTDCASGENAFDCIQKFARCDGGTSICTLAPGTYVIRAAAAAALDAKSEPFQVAGTAITDLLQSLVGAPAVEEPTLSLGALPSGTSSDSGTAGASAVQGGTPATTTVRSGYSVACPQEGWRAYLACPHGGCITGWNVCRGGVWILDSVQTTVVVGMQGPCDSNQVWCGIGYGFGCVDADQCINGNAL